MRFRLAGVIALCVLASIATTFARVPQGRGAGAGAVTVPQVTASPQPNAPPPPPLVTTGLIVGRVIDAGTGRPISGAIVTLNGGPQRTQLPPSAQPPGTGRAASFPTQPPRVLTDAEGRFAFRNLTRGSYNLATSKSGYMAGAYGRNRPEGPSRGIALDDNEKVADAVVRMFKFASITGHIIDEAGEPIVAAQVKVYRRVLVSGRRRFRDAGTTSTDDRGIYRIGNLAPGDYVAAAPLTSITAPLEKQSAGFQQNYSLSGNFITGGGPELGAGGRPVGDGRFALQSNNNAASMDSSGKWRGYSTQYYPASRTIGSAEIMALPSGEDRSGVDIQMRYVPVSNIFGTLTAPDGAVAGMVLRLIPTDTDMMTAEPEAASTMTDATGAFMFAAVPSGQYVIQAIRVAREPQQLDFYFQSPSAGAGQDSGAHAVTAPQGRGNARPPTPMLWANVPVTVGDSDIGGVNVAMQEGFNVTGRFEFTGARAKPNGQQLAQIPVVVESADGRDNYDQGMPSRSNNDGRFVTASKAPGKYFVRIGGSPPGFIVQSVTVNGLNATDMPFDLTGNATAVVTFTDQIASVNGTVQGFNAAEDPPLVVLFPADSRAWKDFGINPMRMKSSRAVAPAGTFQFGSLVAGDYFLAAVPDAFSSEWQDPAYLELIARSADRVTLSPGDKRAISVEVTTARPPGAGRDPIAQDCIAAECQQTQVRDTRAPAQEPHGPGSISGTVSVDDNGSLKPARLARVRLTSSALGFERTALTDELGQYSVPSLPAGDYTVSVTKPAYLQMYYGARRPTFSPGTPVHVDGKAVANINVTLAKGAVISGTVFDDQGQPAPGVRVQLMNFTRREGERIVTNASAAGGVLNTVTTDDRGEYRFYGLRPGRYTVMATPSGSAVNQELRQLSEGEIRTAMTDAAKSPVSPSVLTSGRQIAPAPPGDLPPTTPPGRAIAYSPLYYPGTSTVESAGELAVTVGQELNSINIPLRLVPASRIEGRVIGPNGQVATQAQVQLFKATGASSTSGVSTRNQQGLFQATGVAAGHYTLVATLEAAAGRGAAAGTPTGVFVAQQELDLNGDDLLNLVLTLAPLPTITGRVMFDGTPPPNPKDVQVSAEPVPGSVLGSRETRPATADENGVFTISGVMPGKYRLNARIVNRTPSLPPASADPSMPQPPPPLPPNSAVAVMNATGWAVLSASVAGQDAFVSSFEIRAGQPLSDAEVVMTNKPAEISGKLIDASNKPVTGMTVVLFPVDRTHWMTNAARLNRISRPNATGTFSFPLALPGEYYLCVLTELDNLDWAEPDFKEQLAAAAVKVTVAKGEKKVQDFKVGG